MHQLENRLITRQLPGGVGKIVVGDQLAADHLVQAMLDADTLPEVVSCKLVTDYDFPDTTRKLPRYQAVFELVHY